MNENINNNKKITLVLSPVELMGNLQNETRAVLICTKPNFVDLHLVRSSLLYFLQNGTSLCSATSKYPRETNRSVFRLVGIPIWIRIPFH